MSNLIKILLNIRSLRAFSRELTLQQLEEGLNKFKIVVQERKKIEEQKHKYKAQQKAKLAAITDQIEKDGIDINALISALSREIRYNKIKRKRPPRPARYKYVNANGDEKTWTGQGRTPSAIQEELDAGKSLEYFAI
ncbi:DNA-binding protein H-NS [Candidatus Photodesmus katoptron]|uniref:DNA-binding protein n=1 Tax=Candidatus Photodesmus katoptron Akat1 TaxID=1236703 RepID=S3DGT6_9GAMM|nr:H-NS family nucleoid-associated regulatory protein [Candidatus Photodesmus katoptron]EPE37682.1 DNA-binding protein StpA [Candidatus Photodesmus katoptron Akat1]KEY90597.1 DNA-binding protein H-NS [Candidatus Photodesmus katoptron]